jgi:hypothetical protein
MRKMLLIGCALIFVFCAKKQSTVQTEGLEEVIVFGEEETSYVSETPVLPTPEEEEVVAPPIAEEPTPPPEEEIAPAPIAEEEPVLPPPEEEIAIAPPPPIEEEPMIVPTPMEEEIVAPPPIEEEPMMPAPIVEETPPAIAEEPYMPPVVTPTAPPPSPPPASILGFRIQIFASSTQKNASRVADDARAAFTENVYVQHVAPYYKVRVGDFLTREDAQALQQRALQKGYRGAFVVETMIAP